MESQYTGFYFETFLFFSHCNQRREGWQWRSKLCFMRIKAHACPPRMQGQALLLVPQVQQAVRVQLMTP